MCIRDRSYINQLGGTRPCSFLYKKLYTVRGHTNLYIKTVHTKSYINHVGGTRPSYQFLYCTWYIKERYAGAVLLCCVLLSAGARGLSIRNGVSIQICRRYWRRGQGKKPIEKTESIFGFVSWGNRKTDRKKRLSVFGSQPWWRIYAGAQSGSLILICVRVLRRLYISFLTRLIVCT